MVTKGGVGIGHAVGMKANVSVEAILAKLFSCAVTIIRIVGVLESDAGGPTRDAPTPEISEKGWWQGRALNYKLVSLSGSILHPYCLRFRSIHRPKSPR